MKKKEEMNNMATRSPISWIKKKVCPTSKRSQMKLSFGMIFSIILIVAFLAVAFYAIYVFLGINESAKIAKFTEGLQNDVDKLWTGSKGTQSVDYFLPSKVDGVCFQNKEQTMRFLPPLVDVMPVKIEHLNISEITKHGDLCINKTDDRVHMVLKKGYGENLVLITKQNG